MSEDDKAAPEQPDSSGLGALLKVSGAVVALLAGIHALTGWNPISLVHPEPRAAFVVVSYEFAGSPCDPGCGMHAILRNNGGRAGSATATFELYSSEGGLADCTAIIPKTSHEGLVKVGCTAFSADLDDYWEAHPKGKVSMYVSVDNPT